MNARPTSTGSESSPPPVVWERCEVVHDGDEFFARLERAIGAASTSIDLEFYIFATDTAGSKFIESLSRAAARGVRVRLLVDGIGSSGFARTYGEAAKSAGVEYRVFNEAPWERWRRGGDDIRQALGSRLTRVFRRLNNRNHRKVCIIDGRTAFVGSFNVTKHHLVSMMGAAAWRDTGSIVEGMGVATLAASFEYVWGGRLKRFKRRLKQRRELLNPLVRLNVTRRQRREMYVDLLLRLVRSQQRIWITNAYFIPDGSLLRVLSVAAESGVDVRVLVPGFSDVVFVPWITSAFHFGLLSAGVKIFEYRGSVLHAKTMVVDEWGLVGSSNLNHRSLLHDLEADVVVTGPQSLSSLEEQFLRDLGRSVEVTLENWRQRPWLERVLGRVFLAFRYVM